MSSAVLREAAALMRSRAEAAPDSHWFAVLRQDGRAWIDVPDEDGHALAMHGFQAAATHIASWHPAVALAIADWLDEVAWRSEHFPKQYRAAKHALAVATAYLGHKS